MYGLRKQQYNLVDFLDDRFTLTFLIFELNIFSKLYLNKLKRIAKHNPKIVFLKPVPADKLVEFGNQFDIGLFFMPPSNYNEEYSLANKVFQYIQSRLMLAVSPLPEMKNIVEKMVDKYGYACYNESAYNFGSLIVVDQKNK